MQKLFISLLALCLIGCSSGFNRDLMSAELSRKGIQITSKSISEIKKRKPQLDLPFRLAVHIEERDLQLKSLIKKELKPAVEKIVSEGIASDVFFISETAPWEGPSSSKGLEGIRTKAAEYGADAVMIVYGVSDVDSYVNASSILYLTLVGAFIVPGTHKDALYILSGSVWDVNNGFLYAAAEAEGQASIVRPVATIERNEAIRPAMKEAIANFSPEIMSRFRNLARQIERKR
jgi:rhombotail lipoprotein